MEVGDRVRFTGDATHDKLRGTVKEVLDDGVYVEWADGVLSNHNMDDVELDIEKVIQHGVGKKVTKSKRAVKKSKKKRRGW